MTAEQAASMVAHIAYRHGFKVEEGGGDYLRIRVRDDSGLVNITYREELVGADYTKGEMTFKPTFGATIARIGAYPTTEELLQTAATIKRAAYLVDDLNKNGFTYTVTM